MKIVGNFFGKSIQLEQLEQSFFTIPYYLCQKIIKNYDR